MQSWIIASVVLIGLNELEPGRQSQSDGVSAGSYKSVS